MLVVWKLDRLSRSLTDLLMVMEKLWELKAGFKSLTELVNTKTPSGRMMMQTVGSYAEFERAMLRVRTLVGLANARKQGRIGGKPRKIKGYQRWEVLKRVTRGRRMLLTSRGYLMFIRQRSHGFCREFKYTRGRKVSVFMNNDQSEMIPILTGRLSALTSSSSLSCPDIGCKLP